MVVIDQRKLHINLKTSIPRTWYGTAGLTVKIKLLFCLHFTTNEHTADRQISLFGEGLARTNPNMIQQLRE